MRDIEVKRATAFPGVPTMWIAIASLPIWRAATVVAGQLRIGGAPLPVESHGFSSARPHEAKSAGHERDLFARTAHPPEGPAEKPGSIGPDAARHRLDVVALDDPKKVLRR